MRLAVAHGADQHAGPLLQPGGGDDGDVEPAIGRRGVGQRLHATLQRADVADQHAARRPLEERRAVDGDLGLERVTGTGVAHALADVGEHSEAVLVGVGAVDHRRVEARCPPSR